MPDLLNKISVITGTAKCNAKCEHCGGIILRKYAPKNDKIVDYEGLLGKLVHAYKSNVKSLSISSCGEPTLSPNSVTGLLKMIHDNGLNFNDVSIYTNGIRIGEDEFFCEKYLPMWKSYGLSRINLTVHSVDSERNAQVYKVNSYPELSTIISNIQKYGYSVRANMILGKKIVSNFEDFKKTAAYLLNHGVVKISAWMQRDKNDEIDLENIIDKAELEKINEWAKSYPKISLYEPKGSDVNSEGKLMVWTNGEVATDWKC